MLPDSSKKEQISLAYLMAVAAKAGFATEFTRVDNDSIDATICCRGKLSNESILYSPEIKIQMKATSNPSISDNHLIFQLPLKNYNDLRAKTGTPRLLVVLCLPNDASQWMLHSPEELIVRKCAYYLNLNNFVETSNTTSVNVHVPITNIISPDSLNDLMLKASKQEEL